MTGNQWEFMHGLMETAIYGGRVDNTFDMRVLQSYLQQFFNSDVITGHTSTSKSGRHGRPSLPVGNIPVSSKIQVSEGE